MVKSWFMSSERDIYGVITVWRILQHTDKQEVEAEEKLQPKVLLGVGRYKISQEQ